MESAGVKFSASFKYQLHNGKLEKIFEIGSLLDLSAFTVTICLYRHFCHPEDTEPRETVNKLKDDFVVSVSTLSLPLTLKKKILHLRGPIGYQLALMKSDHDWFIKGLESLFINFSPKFLIWTSEGSIDRKKTAEIFVSDEEIDGWKRYALASIYFLETYVYKLIPFYKGGISGINNIQNFFLSYWKRTSNATYCLDDDDDELEIHLRIAVNLCNLAAIDYFTHKVEPDHLKNVVKKLGGVALGDLFSNKRHIVIQYEWSIFQSDQGAFFDLFSLVLSKEEKYEVFKNYPGSALLCFAYWPRDCQFMEMAHHLYRFLGQKDFDNIVKTLIADDIFCFDIFKEFWLNSPKLFRENFNITEVDSLKMIELFREEDRCKIFMKLILELVNQDKAVTKGDFYFFKILLFIFTSTEDELIELIKLETIVPKDVGRSYYFLEVRKETDRVGKILEEKFNASFPDLCEKYCEIIEKIKIE